MKNFKIILIEPNKIQNLNPYSNEFNNSIMDIVKVVQVSNENIMDCICEHLQMVNNNNINIMGDTILCHETYDKKMFELCFIDSKKNELKHKEDNDLSSHLCYIHQHIDGPSVFMCSKINLQTGLPENIDIDVPILKQVLNDKFIHTGVYIHNSGKMVEFTFHNDLNVLNEQNNKNYDILSVLSDIALLIKNGLCYEYSIFKYDLIIIIPRIEKDHNIATNKIMSVFLEDSIAKGNFIIIHKISKNDYSNITINEIKQFVYLYKSKQMVAEDTMIEKINNIEKIKNKYMILYNKFKQYRKKNNEQYSNLLNDDIFNKFVLEKYNEVELLNTDNIFNIIVINEIKKANIETEDKHKLINEFIKDKNIEISHDTNLDIIL
jgi:hypothetical protein